MAHLIYRGEDGQDRVVPLDEDHSRVVVGRAPHCEAWVDEQSVSRAHAEFVYRDGRYGVFDLESSNGTWICVGGAKRRIRAAPLADGELIWCGELLVRFEEAEGTRVYKPRTLPSDMGFEAAHSSLEESTGSVARLLPSDRQLAFEILMYGYGSGSSAVVHLRTTRGQRDAPSWRFSIECTPKIVEQASIDIDDAALDELMDALAWSAEQTGAADLFSSANGSLSIDDRRGDVRVSRHYYVEGLRAAGDIVVAFLEEHGVTLPPAFHPLADEPSSASSERSLVSSAS